ncbi:hypothetical protein ACIRON_23155 [Nocardioides sp. NPDC101246]
MGNQTPSSKPTMLFFAQSALAFAIALVTTLAAILSCWKEVS